MAVVDSWGLAVPIAHRRLQPKTWLASQGIYVTTYLYESVLFFSRQNSDCSSVRRISCKCCNAWKDRNQHAGGFSKKRPFVVGGHPSFLGNSRKECIFLAKFGSDLHTSITSQASIFIASHASLFFRLFVGMLWIWMGGLYPCVHLYQNRADSADCRVLLGILD